MEQMYLNIPSKLFDAVAVSAPLNGTEKALPANSTILSWQTFYGTAPASITMQLQASEDDVNWATIDSSTNTAGELKTVNVAAPFIRARINAVTGGTTASVLVNAKNQ